MSKHFPVQMMPEEQAELAQATLDAADPEVSISRLVEAMDLGAVEAALANPSLPLMAVEHPNLWAMLTHFVRERVAASPRCPVSFAEWVIHATRLKTQGEDEEYRSKHIHMRALLRNPVLLTSLRREAFLLLRLRLNAEELQGFLPTLQGVLTPDEYTLLSRALTPGGELASSEVEALAKLGWQGAALALCFPTCPAALIERLWPRMDAIGQLSLMSHPNLSAATLAEALTAPMRQLRATAAKRGRLTAEQFRDAALGADLRLAVAINPGLPVEWAEHLAADPNEYQRAALAKNPSLPPEVQLRLATDPSKFVRVSLLDNPNVTAESRAVAEARNRLGP